MEAMIATITVSYHDVSVPLSNANPSQAQGRQTAGVGRDETLDRAQDVEIFPGSSMETFLNVYLFDNCISGSLECLAIILRRSWEAFEGLSLSNLFFFFLTACNGLNESKMCLCNYVRDFHGPMPCVHMN
jgi:hypothetical protein